MLRFGLRQAGGSLGNAQMTLTLAMESKLSCLLQARGRRCSWLRPVLSVVLCSARRGEERGRGRAEAGGLGAAGAHGVQRAGFPPAQQPGRQAHPGPVRQDQGEEQGKCR